MRQRGRWLLAAVSAPLTLVGTIAAPGVAAVGGAVAIAAAAGVLNATPAKAATTGSVLVLLQNGEATAPETTLLQAVGYSVTQATPAQWQAMTASAFEGYAALVIGDPSSGGSCSALTPTAGTSGIDALGTNWQAAVSGNIAVLGTAPALPGTSAADTLITDAIRYAAAKYSSGAGTGLYVSLNCEYQSASPGTDVALMDGVEGIGAAGGLTVQGNLACADPGTVNKWELAAAGTFSGFTTASLGTSAWPSPACPVQEAFSRWPAMFTPAAYDAASDVTANFTASDGTAGQPYVLLGKPVSAATAALASATGGEVPAGATAGGQNPAAVGVSQPTAGDPVNTENGDFTQSATDASIPTFGPALEFTRTYDAQQARQETVAGTPGPMGYGWSDNWATSLSGSQVVPGDIYTIDGLDTDSGNGTAATSQTVDNPNSVAVFGGNTYIAEMDNRVEEIPGTSGTQWGIAMTAGHMYTVAGSPSGVRGQSGNGTAAASTLLYSPWGVAVNASGLYIADNGNCRVVELAATTGTQWGISMAAGDMYVIAGRGSGNCGVGSDNVAATASDLSGPTGLFFGAGTSAGSLYIADGGNNRIQELVGVTGTQWGQSMTANDIYTAAGSSAGTGGDTAPGSAATSTLLNNPQGVSVGGGGNLYVADTNNCRVLFVPNGSGTAWGQTTTANHAYILAGRDAGHCDASGDGSLGTASDLAFPQQVWSGNGNVYIADTNNNRIQEVAGSAHTEFGQSMTYAFAYTVAGSSSGTYGFSGDGGAAGSAKLGLPESVWVDISGNLYIADSANYRVRMVDASSYDISTIAGNGGSPSTWGDGGPAVTAGVSGPSSLATDARGDEFIADLSNNRVQEIVASTHTQFGIAMTAGDVYTVVGSSAGMKGDSGDGGPATAALLDFPEGVAVDPAGNLYISDDQNEQVREVPAASGTQWGQSMTAGDIYTIAGSTAGTSGTSGNGGPAGAALLQSPDNIAADSHGDIYVNDGSGIREIAAVTGTQWGQSMTAGDIYTIAGDGSGGIALDAAGDLYMASAGGNQVREVPAASGTQWGQSMTAGDTYTIAGGTSGISGNGIPATSATLNDPTGIALDAAGDLYIADKGDNQVREVPAASGTQWGQSMTAGDIYTVAGTGTPGTSGNGGPATSALLFFPAAVSTDANGDLLIADRQIREVFSTATPRFPASPAGNGITIAQPNGSQVTFYPKTSGTCAAPYAAVGGYCTLPENLTASLTYNSAAGTYAYSPQPGTIYTYSSSTGALLSETDAAGSTIAIQPETPAPGSGNCPATASSCQTITAASGRSLVLGSDVSGRITSVTDPMGRTWTYAYNSADDLTSATDPMSHVTSYTYGSGSTGNPQLASDLLTITDPNAQSGGPDAGDATVNVYDSAGRVTSQTDPMGFKTTFNYCVNAAAGNCMDPATGTGYVTVNDPDGNSTLDYYDQGTLAAQTNITSGTVTSEQDNTPDTTTGTLLNATTTDGDGDTTSYTYDSRGNVTSATDPAGSTATNQSTALNQDSCDATAEATAPCTSSQAGPAPVAPGGVITPPSSAPPSGVTYTLYDTSGNELYTDTGVYQPGSSTASYQKVDYTLYKGNSVTLNGTTITCTYTPPSPSLPCAKINPDGVVTQMQYDSAGDLTLSAAPDGNGSELATTTYGYDGDGEQTTKISPDGNLSGANAANYTTITAYNNDRQKTSVTQAGGSGATVTPRVTNYGYDPSGNQTTVQDAHGYTTTTAYNADNKATLITDPLGNATLTCYDGDGHTTQTVLPTGVAASKLTPASCPAAYPVGYGTRLATDATTYTYDATGFKTAMTTPAPAGRSGSETTTYTYDAAGNVIKTDAPPSSNASGAPDNVTYDTYNSNGELTSQTTGYGTSTAATVSYCYDPSRNKTAVVSGDGNTNGTAPCETSYPWVVSPASNPTQAAYQTTYAYDSVGEQVSTTTPATVAAPSGATTTTTYDPAGNELTTKDPNGVTTTYTYTPAGQKATVTYSGSAAHSVTYTYDADGFKTAMADASGSSAYTPDPFGELATDQNGNGQTVSYTYNADGNIATITYPLPSTATWATTNTISYGYDNADRLTSVTDLTGGKITITPNADGQQKSETLGSTGDMITTNYDNTGTGIASKTLSNSSSTLQSFTYSDAPDGSIITETDSPSTSGTSKTYTYDAQGRVASETAGSLNVSYGFDQSGNLAGIPGGAAGTYDNNGELTSSTLSGTTTDYAYNADGERTGAAQAGSTIASAAWNGASQLTAYSNSTGNMTSATYDGDGLRASSATGSGTQNYVWTTVSQVPQLLADSTNAYIYTGGGTTPAEQVNLSSGTVTYLVADSLGSARGTVNSSGSLTGTTTYDAWGNPLTIGGLTAATPFGYAGGYTDSDGLIYLINRYYDPATSQFISSDPEVAQTQQPYSYANGDPVELTDPNGLSAFWEQVISPHIVYTPWGDYPVPAGAAAGWISGNGTYISWLKSSFAVYGVISNWYFRFRLRNKYENLLGSWQQFEHYGSSAEGYFGLGLYRNYPAALGGFVYLALFEQSGRVDLSMIMFNIE